MPGKKKDGDEFSAFFGWRSKVVCKTILIITRVFIITLLFSINQNSVPTWGGGEIQGFKKPSLSLSFVSYMHCTVTREKDEHDAIF